MCLAGPNTRQGRRESPVHATEPVVGCPDPVKRYADVVKPQVSHALHFVFRELGSIGRKRKVMKIQSPRMLGEFKEVEARQRFAA